MFPQNQTPRSGDRVVVIGGGATGAIVSVFLAEAGFKVTCLEKTNVGNGSSSRSAACIRAQFSVPETALGMAYSEHFFVNFHERMETPAEERCWMIRQNGYLWLYEHPDHYEVGSDSYRAAGAIWQTAQEKAAMHLSIGLPVEVLKPDEVHHRWPHLDKDRLIGGTFCRADGFLNHDQIYMLGFRRAKELGVELLQNMEVTGAVSKSGRLTSIQTSKDELPCDWVVNATNAWAPRVSRTLGGMELRISPIKRYLWHYLTKNPGVVAPNNWHELPMTIYGMGNGRGVYSRPEAREIRSGDTEAELIIGWAHKADPEPDFCDEDQIRVDMPYSSGDYADEIRYQLADFSYELADKGIIRSGASLIGGGYYAVTPDESPMIGYDDRLVNLVHAAGFSGHGLMHVPITALIVRELLVNGSWKQRVCLPAPYDQHTMSLAVFAPDRTIDLSCKEHMVI